MDASLLCALKKAADGSDLPHTDSSLCPSFVPPWSAPLCLLLLIIILPQHPAPPLLCLSPQMARPSSVEINQPISLVYLVVLCLHS